MIRVTLEQHRFQLRVSTYMRFFGKYVPWCHGTTRLFESVDTEGPRADCKVIPLRCSRANCSPVRLASGLTGPEVEGIWRK